MFNKNSSAGTAAQKRSKRSLFSRLPLLLAIPMLCAVFVSCKQKDWFPDTKEKLILIDNLRIPMPDYYKRVTGFDSIQLVMGGRGKYNEAKQDYDVTWDSLYANFCYPNKWEFDKFKKDTVFIHDTVYTSKNYGNIGTLNQY